jgi:hypothetical protein
MGGHSEDYVTDTEQICTELTITEPLFWSRNITPNFMKIRQRL